MKNKYDDNYLKKELYDLVKKDESIFDFIQESSLDGLWYWDLENPENEWMNARFWTTLGYNPKDMPYNPSAWQDIINKDDLKLALDNFNKHCENSNHPYDQIVRYKHKNGSTVWIRCRGIVIRDKKDNPIRMLGAHHDITEQKKVEHELILEKEKVIESENRFRSIIENSEAGYFFIDKEGLFQEVNKAWLKLYKYDNKNEVIGKHFTKVQKIDDIENAEAFVEGILNKNPVYMNGEFSRLCKDGSIGYHSFSARPAKLDNSISGIEGFIIDTTKQKYFEQELIKLKNEAEKNEEKFRQLFENMEQGFAIHQMIYDDEGKPVDYRFVMINKAFERLTNINASDFIGKTVKETLPNTEQIWIDNYGRVAKDGVSMHFENFSKEFNKYYDVIAYSPKKDFFAVIFTDVTKNKIREQELTKAKEKAEESDHLKTEFINNMSHEIRTPMNGILGFSGFLNRENLSDEKRKHYINIIQNSGNQLMHVIDDILEISKLGTKQVKIVEKEICLNDLLLELFSVFDVRAKQNKTPLYLRKGLSDKESIILTDNTKLKTVLSNLIENALKFTHTGFIEFGYNLKNAEINIYIMDTGIGIKSEKQQTIFDRFSQEEKELSKNVGGLGLGLSIAKEYTELLGGRIILKSKKGKGSTFTVTIPYNPVNDNHLNNEITGVEEKQDEYTVLIVEDEEINYLFLEALLEDEIDINFNILHARNGKDAVDICRNNNEVNLVLMDIKMPIMNGLEATKLIKEFKPDLPIIAQTGYSTKEDKEKTILAGCDDVIIKPILSDILLDCMNKYLKME